MRQRFAFRYRLPTAPIALGIGLLPPVTFAALDDESFRVRLGPWFVLEAPRDSIADADVARGDLTTASVAHRNSADGYGLFTVRTAPGPVARVRFAEPATAKLLIGPPRLKPRFVPLNLGPTLRVDEINLSLHRPETLVDALR